MTGRASGVGKDAAAAGRAHRGDRHSRHDCCKTDIVAGIEDRLDELGIELPAPLAAPSGVRLPFDLVRVHGGLAYISGHGPFDGDRLLITGRVGAEVSVDQAYDAGRASVCRSLRPSDRSSGPSTA